MRDTGWQKIKVNITLNELPCVISPIFKAKSLVCYYHLAAFRSVIYIFGNMDGRSCSFLLVENGNQVK